MKFFLFNLTKLLIIFVLSSLTLSLFVAITTYWTPKIENLTFGHISNWGNTYERSLDFKNWNKLSNKPKGVILGSSTAYRNINSTILTQQTNINWFILGSNAQSPPVSLILFKNLIEKTNPDYIIIDIYGGVYENNGRESAYDLINNSTFPLSLKLKLFTLVPNYHSLQILIYRYLHEKIKGNLFIRKKKSNGKYIKGGSTFTPYKRFEIDKNDKLKFSRIKINKELRYIINYCDKKSIIVIINISPIIGRKQIYEIDYDKVIVNDDFNHRNDLFYDDHHMHGKGSVEYTKKLAEKLKLSKYINSFKSTNTIRGSN